MSPHDELAERPAGDHVSSLLARLTPDQRAAATAPSGPVLCVAPAGSGKTTTLVARVAWLVAGGVAPASITVLAFNRRAAEEVAARLDVALAPLGRPAGEVRVRTFHALGLEILREAGLPVRPLVDRMPLLREFRPAAEPAELAGLDLAISRLKLDLAVTADEVAADPAAGPVARTFVAYERAIERTGGLDFDDLVARAVRLLERDATALGVWRARCRELLVDEAQDLDRSQLRLALSLAAPANRIFLVGDDDQSIYGWRLADVRRVLGLADVLPGLRRVDLTVNHRCPAVVVDRAVRLVEHNRARFAKRIAARADAGGRLVLAADGADDAVRVGRVIDRWPGDDTPRAILARTNRELLPAIAAAIDRGVPFRAPPLSLLVEDPRVDVVLAAAARLPASWPLLVRLGRVRAASARGDLDLGRPDNVAPETDADGVPAAPADDVTPADTIVAAILAWAAGIAELATLTRAVAERRRLLTVLRRDDAPLALATAHATKGAEWDHVAVLTDGFPARRAVAEAADPAAVLEEERRLAYVAWTRARRSLTLVYDPAAVSPFLAEAFDPAELGLPA